MFPERSGGSKRFPCGLLIPDIASRWVGEPSARRFPWGLAPEPPPCPDVSPAFAVPRDEGGWELQTGYWGCGGSPRGYHFGSVAAGGRVFQGFGVMTMFLRTVTRRARPGVGSWFRQCPRNRFAALVLLTVTAVAAAGCISTARMAVPPALASAPAWPVSGRQGWKLNERLSFGPFRAEAVRRSWTRGSDWKVAPYEQSRRRQTFGFTLVGEGRELLRGEFQTTLQRRGLDVGFDVDLQNRSALEGQLRVVGDGTPAGWTLKLREEGQTPWVGTVTGGSVVLRVTGTARLQGSPLPLDQPSGYIISLGDRDLAAVEVIGDGMVRFADGIDPALQPVVAGTAAALLLVEELRATLPE